MFFRFTALMRRVRRFCAGSCGAGKCWRSSADFRAALSGWKRVQRPTIGRASWPRSEAVQRPTMRFVPVKTAEQQASQLLHRGREQLVRQRTMLVNALRAHLAEFGIVATQGLRNVGQLIAMVRDDDDRRLPDLARQVLQVLADQIEQIEAAITALERQLLSWHKSNAVSQRLASIPGIGPIIATAIATTVADPNVFRSGREFAAWLGLVPRQNSTGGKTRLGGITKRGNRYLRRLRAGLRCLSLRRASRVWRSP